MGLFKKKYKDPFTQRAKDLENKISGIEAEIRRLQEQKTQNGAASAREPGAPPTNGTVAHEVTPLTMNAIPQIGGKVPKLKSTAHPNGPTVTNEPATAPEANGSHAPSLQEPIFEEIPQNPFRNQTPEPEPPKDQSLGIRQDDLASTWQRWKANFRGPVASNPKLVNYLAAGSIQGLPPLRYERRVARNRFIALVVILVMILWGILVLLLKN